VSNRRTPHLCPDFLKNRFTDGVGNGFGYPSDSFSRGRGEDGARDTQPSAPALAGRGDGCPGKRGHLGWCAQCLLVTL
jgi:hypothetical protein